MQTVVGINPWVAHANKKVYGPNAESFYPDRWLGEKSSMQDAYDLTVRFLLWTQTLHACL